MTDSRLYPVIAAHVLDTLKIREGDAVLIRGGAHQSGFLEEIGIDVARRGGQPFLQYMSDDFHRRMLETCKPDQLRRTPKIFLAAAEAMDKYVIIEPYSDPALRSGYREAVQAMSEGLQPVYDIMFRKPGKPSVFMGWATMPMAEFYGLPLPALEQLVIGSCTIDYGKLAQDCRYLIAALDGAKYVHVTDSRGTDFRLCIEDRTLIADDGQWSEEKEANGNTGGNLPAGEVYVAPVETYGEGTIYCPVTTDELAGGVIIRGALLYFKDGMLVPEKCTAVENEAVLRDSLNRFVETDMNNYGTPNALKVAELGIGLNPAVDRAIGYILTDEKLIGSVHVAFGLSSEFGGSVISCMHWDFVTAPEATLEVEYKDGRRKQLIKEGKFLT